MMINQECFSPTRRALLGVAAGAVTIVAAPALSSPLESSADRPWDRRLAAYRAAKAEAENYWRTAYKPAWKKRDRITGQMPKLSFTITARSGQVATYIVDPLNDDQYSYAPLFEHHAAPIRAAYKAWLAVSKECESDPEFRRVDEEADRLWTEEGLAEDLLFAEPSPDAVALAIKVGLALNAGTDIRDDHHEELLRDVARFGGGI